MCVLHMPPLRSLTLNLKSTNALRPSSVMQKIVTLKIHYPQMKGEKNRSSFFLLAYLHDLDSDSYGIDFMLTDHLVLITFR